MKNKNLNTSSIFKSVPTSEINLKNSENEIDIIFNKYLNLVKKINNFLKK